MRMIILDATQADQVRGPSGHGCALDPVVLADGVTWVLPERVLDAETHPGPFDLLSSLTVREVAAAEFVQAADDDD